MRASYVGLAASLSLINEQHLIGVFRDAFVAALSSLAVVGVSYTTSRERDAARPGWKGKATRAAQCYLFGTIFPSAPTVISCDWLPVITVIL